MAFVPASTWLVIAGPVGSNPPGPGGPAPTLPDDLVDAVVLLVNGSLVELGPLHWFGTGVAPQDDDLFPFGLMTEPDEATGHLDTAGTGLADGHLQVVLYAPGKKAARALGDRMTAILTDAPLLFAAGTLVYLRQSARSATLDPDPAPGGGDCWQEARIYNFKYAHKLGGS